MAYAQVHRFRDRVAAYLGGGETFYMTPKEARRLARALNKAAKSCETESFVDSACGTFEMQFAGERE